MRQAGRYLPEYRAIREGRTLLDLCRTPELACEVAMQPLRRFDLDAAILFSDLLVPVSALGIDFDIVEKRGPVLARPLRRKEDVTALPSPDLGAVSYVFDAVKALLAALAAERRAVPVLGFAGAPFTMASYLIEGEPSRHFQRTKLLMHAEPEIWALLLDKLSDLVVGYVREQVAAGAQAVQIFDSWAGCLTPADYRRHVLAPTRKIFTAIARLNVPSIHFASSGESLLPAMAEAGGDVLSVDWRIPLSRVRERFPERAVQGNLDPSALMAPAPVLERLAAEVLDEAGGRPGHIFNLGHGIQPEASIDNVARLVETVHARTRRG